MALIIIILSIDTHNNNSTNIFSFLFQGTYNDITADWYLEVGLIIILTMIFNLFSPFAETFIFIFFSIITKIQMTLFNKMAAYKKIKSSYINLYRE